SLANTARLAGDFEQKALAAHDEAEAALEVAEARLSQLTTAAAEARARRQSLEAQKSERRDQIAKLERQLTALEAQTRGIVGRARALAHERCAGCGPGVAGRRRAARSPRRWAARADAALTPNRRCCSHGRDSPAAHLETWPASRLHRRPPLALGRLRRRRSGV